MFNYIKKPKTLEELSDLLDTLSFVDCAIIDTPKQTLVRGPSLTLVQTAAGAIAQIHKESEGFKRTLIDGAVSGLYDSIKLVNKSCDGASTKDCDEKSTKDCDKTPTGDCDSFMSKAKGKKAVSKKAAPKKK